MARISPFISDPTIPAGIQTTQAEPGKWAQPAEAAQRGAAMMGDAFSNAVNAWAAYSKKQEDEQQRIDDLYVAQAKADIQIQQHEAMKAAQASAKAGGTLGADFISAFDKMTIPVLENAPNDKTREHLLKSFIGMRSKAYEAGNNYQLKMDYDHDLNSFGDEVNKLRNLALSKPSDDSVTALRQQIEQYGQAMKNKGYGALEVDKHVRQQQEALDIDYAKWMAQENPEALLSRLNKNAFNTLTPDQVSRLNIMAQSTIAGAVKEAEAAAKEAEANILKGYAPPKNFFESTGKAITKYPSATGAVASRVAELQGLNNFRKTAISMPTPALDTQKRMLQIEAAQNPNLSQLNQKKIKMIEELQKEIDEDPLYYAHRNGLVQMPAAPSNLKDPATLPEFFKARQTAAAQAEATTGVKPPLLTNKEISDVWRPTVKDMNVSEKIVLSQALSQLDADTVNKFTSSVGDKTLEGTFGTATAVARYRPEAAAHIIKGSELLKVSNAAKASDTQAVQEVLESIKGVFPEAADHAEQVVKAARAYQASADPTKPVSADTLTDLFNIQKVHQGGTWFGSYKTRLPFVTETAGDGKKVTRSVTPEEFSKTISGLDEGTLQLKGINVPHYGPGRPFDFSRDKLSNYQFKPMGLYSDKYIVTDINGRPLKNADDSTYYIDGKKLFKGD